MILPLFFCVLSFTANALENNYGNLNIKLSGYGTAGYVNTDNKSNFANDWYIRAQASYHKSKNWLFGAVISHSAWYLAQEKPAMDAFTYVESPWGRAELGWTDTIATKLGLGLPDVSGLRINKDLIIYDFIDIEPTISRTSISGAQFAFRVNVVYQAPYNHSSHQNNIILIVRPISESNINFLMENKISDINGGNLYR